jgi:hypothetical protein
MNDRERATLQARRASLQLHGVRLTWQENHGGIEILLQFVSGMKILAFRQPASAIAFLDGYLLGRDSAIRN